MSINNRGVAYIKQGDVGVQSAARKGALSIALDSVGRNPTVSSPVKLRL